ncbi:pirin [Sphingomonas sp. Leaf357]|uniref:pirin family protein n=1 Tax=Sphingomonas sp. Leaf357 TaxID=1736350 RepID=UPI0006F7970F|nr:pirin family protein [Sphingomonas sp. Leaf357]KQS03584.1 pirin [Sphingomonas sp. Leaf357]
MNSERLLVDRAVARIDDPIAVAGNVAGHRARRLIDGTETAFSDPFILMAEDWMPRDAFAKHPHRGIETVTLVLDGAVEHADSGGNEGLLREGDAQWMTAGRGVTHVENALPGTIAHTVQLWVNLAARDKMTAPRYQTLRRARVPVRHEPGAVIRLLSGTSGDVSSDTLNYVPVTAIDATLDAGGSFDQALAPDYNAFVLVLNGEALVGPDETTVRAGALAWLTHGDGSSASKVRIAASAAETRVLLFAGAPLREPIAFGGPFVMNTPSEIKQAFADYRSGRF